MDNKYHNGKIYRIVCNVTGLVYIGSTCEPTLAKRLAKHKCAYNRFVSNKDTLKISSFKVFENDNYFIELVNYTPCETKDELNKHEGINVVFNSIKMIR